MSDSPKGSVTLVLGGARSGKSRFAENLVTETGLSRIYLATGRAWDDEMKSRIAAHKRDRGAGGWTTIEEPTDIAAALARTDAPDRTILVDCLTLWVTNLMLEEANMTEAFAKLCDWLPTAKGHIVLVTNEVGLGIVPDNAMARAFRDHAGRLHQKVAALADQVYFVAAGLPLKLKG